jgi:hypothetical protein
MSNPWNTVRGILMIALSGAAPHAALAAGASTPEPLARAVSALQSETNAPGISGFRWGSPIAALAKSPQVKPNADLSARCTNDIRSPAEPDCVAFEATSDAGFAQVFYATSREGLLMVESRPTYFDCASFDDLSSPQAGHRSDLSKLGWNYLRRERRVERGRALVETQLFVRNGIGVELTFIKATRTGACGMKSFISKMM